MEREREREEGNRSELQKSLGLDVFGTARMRDCLMGRARTARADRGMLDWAATRGGREGRVFGVRHRSTYEGGVGLGLWGT